MTGIILGGLLGVGLALTGFFVFRWADRRFVAAPAEAPALPARKTA